jgi:mono/diheme cytochrome c family protein
MSFAVTICLTNSNAKAQQSGNVREGRRLAHAECAQCHGVDRKGYSTNPAAPAFDDIANVPGMTNMALMVALRTSPRSMPDLIIKGRNGQNIIAYIISLKRK